MVDTRKPFTVKKKKERNWYDLRGIPHKKTTNYSVRIRKRDKPHK